MTIHVHFRRSVQKFSDHTSIDGVNELYYAKTWFWKVVWFIIVVTALVLTGFQVIRALNQSLKHEFVTMITPAMRDQIRYPAIRLCYLHWIYWVDWQKAKFLNFSKPALLYGLSFITKEFSSIQFDVEQAKVEFLQTLHTHNMSRLTEFYTAIAGDVRLAGGNIDKSYFEERELIYKYPNLLFCYTISEKKIYAFLQNQEKLYSSSVSGLTLKMTLFDRKYENLDDSFITPNEYHYHIALALKKSFQYDLSDENIQENFSQIILPPFIYPNAYSADGVRILPENENYIINFRVTAHRWKNTNDRPCLEGHKSVLPDDKCFTKCHIDYFVNRCSCLYVDNAAFVGKDFPESLCPEAIYFLPIAEIKSIFEFPNQNCEVECPEYVENDKICVKGCLPACETWSYESTVSITPAPNFGQSFSQGKDRTTINIKYPNTGDILLLSETDSWTWEDLIGNIGGLLGIWMGASIVSFVQMVYLCCCAENEIDLCSKRLQPSVIAMNTENVKT